jgi:hypothetical protein
VKRGRGDRGLRHAANTKGLVAAGFTRRTSCVGSGAGGTRYAELLLADMDSERFMASALMATKAQDEPAA